MTTNWKYTDSTHKIVMRILDSGSVESCLVSEISDWIDAGNIPDPVDGPTAAQLWAVYQQQAQDILDFNDKVATRCTKANVPYPSIWMARDVAARAIVTASSGDPTQPLPAQPVSFPDGT